ncbi:unnamed protein product [Amoebophrya sp. A25]|nr:unnamed protein product [Amoebophrya sp. A25]|eukprot:GSA25T00019949001.1
MHWFLVASFPACAFAELANSRRAQEVDASGETIDASDDTPGADSSGDRSRGGHIKEQRGHIGEVRRHVTNKRRRKTNKVDNPFLQLPGWPLPSGEDAEGNAPGRSSWVQTHTAGGVGGSLVYGSPSIPIAGVYNNSTLMSFGLDNSFLETMRASKAEDGEGNKQEPQGIGASTLLDMDILELIRPGIWLLERDEKSRSRVQKLEGLLLKETPDEGAFAPGINLGNAATALGISSAVLINYVKASASLPIVPSAVRIDHLKATDAFVRAVGQQSSDTSAAGPVSEASDEAGAGVSDVVIKNLLTGNEVYRVSRKIVPEIRKIDDLFFLILLQTGVVVATFVSAAGYVLADNDNDTKALLTTALNQDRHIHSVNMVEDSTTKFLSSSAAYFIFAALLTRMRWRDAYIAGRKPYTYDSASELRKEKASDAFVLKEGQAFMKAVTKCFQDAVGGGEYAGSCLVTFSGDRFSRWLVWKRHVSESSLVDSAWGCKNLRSKSPADFTMARQARDDATAFFQVIPTAADSWKSKWLEWALDGIGGCVILTRVDVATTADSSVRDWHLFDFTEYRAY